MSTTSSITFTLSDPISEPRATAITAAVQSDLDTLTNKVNSLTEERDTGTQTVTEIVMGSPAS